MTVNSKSRFNKFIPLFYDKSDDRIRLFLHETQAATDAVHPAYPSYYPNSTHWNILGEIPLGMQNRFYSNKISSKNDTVMHPEWLYFFGAVACRLGGKTISLSSSNPNDKLFMESFKQLHNAVPRSLENLVCAILNKICGFFITDVITSVADGKLVIENNTDIANVRSVVFLSREEIFNYLMHNETEDAISSCDMFNEIFELSGDNEITSDSSIEANIISLQNGLPDTLFKQQLINVFTSEVGTEVTEWPNRRTELFSQFLVSGPLNKREFHYKIDKYLITTILEAHAKKMVPIIEAASHFFTDQPTSEPKYYRKPDGLLYMRDSNNVEIQVDKTSKAMLDLKVDNK